MFAQVRHVAIVSDQYALEGKFYQAVFGMTTADDTRPERAVTVSDGYTGLNINPRKAGRPGGLDHFGLEVATLNDLHTLHDEFLKGGVHMETGVFNNTRGSRFFCRAPGGVLIEINTREDMQEQWRKLF